MAIDKNIKISKVLDKDILGLGKVLKENVPKDSEIQTILSYIKGSRDNIGRLRKYFIAKNRKGEVFGCMAYSKVDLDLQKFFNANLKNSVELLNCFILKKHQGKGIGTYILNAICDEVKRRGKKEIFVQSGVWYKKSWKFYDKTFDRYLGTISKKYEDIGDARVWIKLIR